MYQYDTYYTCEGVIIGIDDNLNNIFVSSYPEKLENVTIDNEAEKYVLYSDYRIAITDMTLQDSNGNIIKKEYLQIGNKIKVVYKKNEAIEMTNPPPLKNIETIIVIE